MSVYTHPRSGRPQLLRRFLRAVVRPLVITAAGMLFVFLVVYKVAVRALAYFGRAAPCPLAAAGLMLAPWRRRMMRPVLDWVGIQPGETVLEVGCGPGLLTLDAARRVGPTGRLVAVDLQPGMIARLAQRLRAAGELPVETHVASATLLPLAAASVDRAFLVSVLDEIPNPALALAELRRVLKPDGVLSVTAEFIDPHYRFVPEMIRQLEAGGFTLAARFGTAWRYTLNFRPAAGPAAGSSYYVARRRRMLRQYDGVAAVVRPLLDARYGRSEAAAIAADARLAFDHLIPELPYIGGRANSLTWNLVGAAWFLALYRALRWRHVPLPEVSALFAEAYAAYLNRYPGWLLRLQGWYAFTPPARWRRERLARRSQARRYTGDWVLATVPPNGHDFGVDYSACGIVTFLQAQGAPELLPCLCRLDYILSERAGLGLERTMTLAAGDALCNFRFRRGGETVWPAVPAAAAVRAQT